MGKPAGILVLCLTFFLLLLSSASTVMAGDMPLRCGTKTAQIGDDELSVLSACGEPYMKKTHQVPVGGRRGVVGYKEVEKWYYNRGRNDFIYILSFETGKLTSIETGDRGF